MENFNDWNHLKQKIHSFFNNKFVHEGEIWWCNLGINVGQEQNGRKQNFSRPVVIIKKFSNKTCLIMPLTTNVNDHKFRIQLGVVKNKKAAGIISQIRVIDTKRLTNKIYDLNMFDLDKIKKTIRDLI